MPYLILWRGRVKVSSPTLDTHPRSQTRTRSRCTYSSSVSTNMASNENGAPAQASENVGKLEENALKRKERLRQLQEKKKRRVDPNAPEGGVKETLPKPVFRTYRPNDESLQDFQIPDAEPERIEEKVSSLIHNSVLWCSSKTLEQCCADRSGTRGLGRVQKLKKTSCGLVDRTGAREIHPPISDQ